MQPIDSIDKSTQRWIRWTTLISLQSLRWQPEGSSSTRGVQKSPWNWNITIHIYIYIYYYMNLYDITNIYQPHQKYIEIAPSTAQKSVVLGEEFLHGVLVFGAACAQPHPTTDRKHRIRARTEPGHGEGRQQQNADTWRLPVGCHSLDGTNLTNCFVVLMLLLQSSSFGMASKASMLPRCLACRSYK